MNLSKKIISVIAITSAVITIIVFVSGIDNIKDFFPKKPTEQIVKNPNAIDIDQLKKKTPIKKLKLLQSDLEDTTLKTATNGVLKLSGSKYLWSGENYDVSGTKKVLVSIDVKSKDSGITIAFSENKKSWDSVGSSDALSFSTTAQNNASFYSAIRTGMFGPFLENTPNKLTSNKWQKVEVILTSNEIVAFIDGVLAIYADLSNVEFPLQGAIGVVNYSKIVEFTNFSVNQY